MEQNKKNKKIGNVNKNLPTKGFGFVLVDS